MLNLDRTAVETFLGRLEEEGYLFSQYQFYKVNNQLQFLGKGGFSVVYEMTDKNEPENHYAMKVIGLERHTITSDVFQRTTILQRHLSSQSPYILRIIDVREIYVSLDEAERLVSIYEGNEESWNGEDIPLQFILMEKLECILLKDKFKNISLISDNLQKETEILKFAMQIGQAIRMAHNNNVLHRDIKLENIFWDEKEKNYKLGDFGIAKYVEGGNAETIVYTDGYGAPEIERRLSDSYNATADIYSFGISLYLLLNGLKFPGAGGYYVNLVQYDPNFIFPAPEKASAELTRIIRKMCSYRREERYQSMAEVLSDLQYVSEKAGIFVNEDCDRSADFATETYREEKESRKKGVNENLSVLEGSVNVSRTQRKQRQKIIDKDYNSACGKYMIGFSVLFVLLLEGMQTDVLFVTRWQFWVLPVAVFVTSIMQQIKDFHIVSGMMTTLFGIYSAYTTGLQIPHIILLLCVIIGFPALTVASAIGTGAWMLLILTDKHPLFGFFSSHDFSWIIIVTILILADQLMRLRQKWNKTSYFRAFVWLFIYDKLPFFMIVLGVLLLILQHFKIIIIPEAVVKMHLVRTGVIVLIASMLGIWWNEESDGELEKIRESGEKIAEENVHMDK